MIKRVCLVFRETKDKNKTNENTCLNEKGTGVIIGYKYNSYEQLLYKSAHDSLLITLRITKVEPSFLLQNDKEHLIFKDLLLTYFHKFAYTNTHGRQLYQ